MNIPYPSPKSMHQPPFEVSFHAPSRELHKGETLYYLGDEAEAVYRVEEGLIKLSVDMLTGRERITSIAGPGDFLGSLTPMHINYQDSAEALSPHVRVTVFSLEQAREDEEVKAALHAAAGVHLSRMREALEDTELPVNARLARVLVRLGNRFGQHSESGRTHLTLPLTHENLASMVGAARETTTAILGEMRKQGLIEGTRGRYSFEMRKLSDFAVAATF